MRDFANRLIVDAQRHLQKTFLPSCLVNFNLHLCYHDEKKKTLKSKLKKNVLKGIRKNIYEKLKRLQFINLLILHVFLSFSMWTILNYAANSELRVDFMLLDVICP